MNFEKGLSARIISYVLLGYVWFSQGKWQNMEPLYRPYSPEFAVLMSLIVVAVAEGVMAGSSSDKDEGDSSSC